MSITMTKKELCIKFLNKNEFNNENPFLVVYKPAGLPTAPLTEYDNFNAFAQAAQYFPQLRQVQGRQNCQREHGLLHRLDTVTSGIILIAATQEAFDSLLKSQKDGLFTKYYRAICKNIENNSELLGNFPQNHGIHQMLLENHKIKITSRFRPFGVKNAQVRPVTDSSGKAALQKCAKKEYTTDISLENFSECRQNKSLYKADCRITEGFRHQIRVHLAWAGFPIAADPLYDSSYNEQAENKFVFEAYRITFPHPKNKQLISFSLPSFD